MNEYHIGTLKIFFLVGVFLNAHHLIQDTQTVQHNKCLILPNLFVGGDLSK